MRYRRNISLVNVHKIEKGVVMSTISNVFNNYPVLGKIMVSTVMLLLTLILISITNKLLFKTIKDNPTYYVAKKRVSFLYVIVFLAIVAVQWSSSKVDLTLYIGFISAGIAISLREIFTNIVSWMIIIVQKPFEVGDRISVNGKTGDVIDLKLFHFVVMDVLDKNLGEQSTGRISHIPNNYIFLHQLTNANKGFGYVWHEIEIKLTQDSDWTRAKEEVYKIVNQHNLHLVDEAKEEVYKASKKYMLYYNNLTPIIYVTFKDGSIVLMLRYLSKPRQCRITEDLIWSGILEAFSKLPEITLI